MAKSFDLWLKYLLSRKDERKALKRMEESIFDLTSRVEQGEGNIMGTLADLALRLEALDATSSEVATWVSNELATLRGQLDELAVQVTDLQASVAQNTIDAAQVDELGVLVDEITATVDAIDDPEVGPQPEEPPAEPVV